MGLYGAAHTALLGLGCVVEQGPSPLVATAMGLCGAAYTALRPMASWLSRYVMARMPLSRLQESLVLCLWGGRPRCVGTDAIQQTSGVSHARAMLVGVDFRSRSCDACWGAALLCHGVDAHE